MMRQTRANLNLFPKLKAVFLKHGDLKVSAHVVFLTGGYLALFIMCFRQIVKSSLSKMTSKNCLSFGQI